MTDETLKNPFNDRPTVRLLGPEICRERMGPVFRRIAPPGEAELLVPGIIDMAVVYFQSRQCRATPDLTSLR